MKNEVKKLNKETNKIKLGLQVKPKKKKPMKKKKMY